MKKTILIVEDEPSIRRLLVQVLEMNGYDTVCAGDGAEALKVIKNRTPDAILTDLRMPVMDGLELLGRIRAINETVPIIVVTVWKEAETIQQVTPHNVFAYFQKPFSMHQLLAKLNEATGASQS